jgi:hypothetical protein
MVRDIETGARKHRSEAGGWMNFPGYGRQLMRGERVAEKLGCLPPVRAKEFSRTREGSRWP